MSETNGLNGHREEIHWPSLVAAISAISAVGIDNYMPLSDWRDGFDHADALEGCVVIEKHQADSFLGTTLGQELAARNVSAIRLVGMMTQHCITHTALSPEAAGLEVTIVGAGCAAPTATLSAIALAGLSGRCKVV